MADGKDRKITDAEKEQAERMAKEFEGQYSEDNVDKVGAKMGGYNKGPLAAIWDNVLALWDLLKDPKAGIPAKATAIGALLYMISPIDVIPDVIPIAGLLDDAAVIGAAVATLASTLAKYKKDKK